MPLCRSVLNHLEIVLGSLRGLLWVSGGLPGGIANASLGPLEYLLGGPLVTPGDLFGGKAGNAGPCSPSRAPRGRAHRACRARGSSWTRRGPTVGLSDEVLRRAQSMATGARWRDIPERGNGTLGAAATGRNGGLPFHARFAPREAAALTAPPTAP